MFGRSPATPWPTEELLRRDAGRPLTGDRTNRKEVIGSVLLVLLCLSPFLGALFISFVALDFSYGPNCDEDPEDEDDEEAAPPEPGLLLVRVYAGSSDFSGA
jgi:hypothetical protein